MAYVIAAPSAPDWVLVGHLVVGSCLALCGGSVLNQLLERDADALMKRTAGRPLPSGRMSMGTAAGFAVVLIGAGILELAAGVNVLTAAMAILGLFVYGALYTPLKRRSSLATVVGAVPGAVPVLMGWAAARNHLDVGAWTLFTMLFLWQLPHFLAIAWMYRADYERAGFRMLPNEDPSGSSTMRQVVGYCVALIPISILPAVFGWAGPWYVVGVIVLGLIYLWAGVRMARERSGVAAKRLLRVSVLYLPLLFVLLALDSRWP